MKLNIVQIGKTLANEMGAIVDRLGPDSPDLLAHLSNYVAALPEHHPDWIPLLRGAHERLLTRRLGATRPRGSSQPGKNRSPRSKSRHAPK